MSRRRQSRAELNFDGLTDSVTNLVGSLILLVVLVIAVTAPKQIGERTPPPPDNTAGDEQPIDGLLETIRLMRAELSDIEQEVQRIEARIPSIGDEIEELKQLSGQES